MLEKKTYEIILTYHFSYQIHFSLIRNQPNGILWRLPFFKSILSVAQKLLLFEIRLSIALDEMH